MTRPRSPFTPADTLRITGLYLGWLFVAILLAWAGLNIYLALAISGLLLGGVAVAIARSVR